MTFHDQSQGDVDCLPRAHVSHKAFPDNRQLSVSTQVIRAVYCVVMYTLECILSKS